MRRTLSCLGLLSCALGPAVGSSPPESPEEPPPVVEAEPEPAPPEPPPALPEGPFTRELAPGLVLSAYLPPEIPDPGYHRASGPGLESTDRRIFVLTAEPDQFEIVFLSVLDERLPGSTRDASTWATEHGLIASWNAGMFEPDGRPTGYTRAGSLTAQSMIRRPNLYSSYFTVAGSKVSMLRRKPPPAEGKYAPFSGLPESFAQTLNQADLVVQSLTLLRDGEPAYPARTKQWSELAYGVDREGRVVVVFSRYPYEMREFGARVKALDLGILHLLHGEGGPEASLVVHSPKAHLEAMGSYETGFFSASNDRLWPLPMVLGLRARTQEGSQGGADKEEGG